MSAGPVPTFISTEEDGDTMTLTYRTDSGKVGRFAFGRAGSPLEFQAVMVSVSGRRSQSDHEVQLYLKKRDQAGVRIMTTTNAEGVDVDEGVEVTHGFRVALKGHEKACLLARRVGDFIHGRESREADAA
jgi:hypothetical protein